MLCSALLVLACARHETEIAKAAPAAGGAAKSEAPAKDDAKGLPTELIEANNRFALDLYKRVSAAEGNLFFSPYSISSALAMTSAGARGETLKQINNTFHFPGDASALHAGMKSLRESLLADPLKRGYELSIANALWGARGYEFAKDFLNLTNEFYDGGLRQIDFAATEEARQTINRWVEKQTRDKIKELIPSGAIDARTRLVLANAIYFKGDWTSPFNERSTRPAPFKLAQGKESSVPFMFQSARFAYKEATDVQVLELPYRGGALSMVIVLPKQIDGLRAVEDSLSMDGLKSWTGELARREVETALPKFKMATQFSLAKELSAMGMPAAFGEQADFSGIATGEKLYLSAVLHKAFIEVNEKGTEAAAATGVVARPTAMPVRPVIFRADHPFLFFIRENKSGGILFIGRVLSPG